MADPNSGQPKRWASGVKKSNKKKKTKGGRKNPRDVQDKKLPFNKSNPARSGGQEFRVQSITLYADRPARNVQSTQRK